MIISFNRVLSFLLVFNAAICFSYAENVVLIWHYGSQTADSTAVETRCFPISGDSLHIAVCKTEIPGSAWALDVIPDFMRAQKGDEGWWMNGRGLYGAFTRDNGSYSNWRQHTPNFLLCHGNTTWMGRTHTYRFDHDFMVTAKDGNYSVFPRYRFDRVREYFPLYDDIILTYKRYDGKNSGYVVPAKDYRSEQFSNGVKPIAERMKDYPDLRYLSNAMVIRLQTHGAKSTPAKPTDFTPETEYPINVYLPFDKAGDFIQAIHDAGVKEAAFVSAGWNKGGYDGALPEHFPVEPILGGEIGLKNMVSRAQNLGFMIMLHGTYTEVYRICPRFDENDIAKKGDGTWSWNGLHFGGSCYWVCERRSFENWIPEEMRRMRALGVKGNHYLDVFSATYPNRCADARHPATPEQMAEYQNRIMAEAKKVFGGACSEGGYDHVAANTDCINYVSVEMKKLFDGKTDPQKLAGLELADGIKPFWEIIYHGTILYNSDRFTQNHTRGQNHAKKDESGNLDWLEGDGIVNPETTLKIAEFGGRPIFYTYKFQDIPAIKRAYDEFQPLKHLQTVLISNHYEAAPGVFVTEYENGEKVVCNYTAENVIYGQMTVPAKEYVILGK